MSDRLRDLAFNELSEALKAEGLWTPLTGRQRIAGRLVALVRQEVAAERQGDYIHITYGPWESSGHQCGDIVVDGCEESVPSRLVTVHDHLGGERVIGSELGDCPNRCGATLDAPKAPGDVERDGKWQ